MADSKKSGEFRTLIVDTCALLDIVRAPVRSSITPGQIQHALEIESVLSISPQPIRVIVCNWVSGEYQRGVEGVIQDVRQQLKSMWVSHRQAVDVMAVHRSETLDQSDIDGWIEMIILHGKTVADSFIQLSPQMMATDEDERLAAQRTRLARAPAHKGKGSLADAVVTEFALRIASEEGLDSDGKPLAVLLSSNTKDFCDGKRLKPDLQAEFDIAGLGFASTWTIARYACIPSKFNTSYVA